VTTFARLPADRTLHVSITTPVRYVIGMSRVLALVLVIAVVAGCGYPKAGPPPGPLAASAVTAAQVRWPTATAASLEQGRQIFLHRCNECHKHPALGAYSDAQWEKIMPRMGGKANLAPAETEQVLQFVLAARTPQRSL
jgi:cytochrome c5